MICQISGLHGTCNAYCIVPKLDVNNACEKILGEPLVNYQPYIITISDRMYKNRYKPHVQKLFAQYIYDKYGKEELMRLIEVLDVLKCEALIRLFAFGILVKNHGIYKPIESKGKWTTINKEFYNRHYRRLSVMMAFKTRHKMSWSDVSNVINRDAKNYSYGRTYLYNDRVWLPIKKKLEDFERSKK